MTQSRNLAALRKRVNKARDFPNGTCPASRHLHEMADALMRKPLKGQTLRYPMFQDEPEHCAESIYSVLASLWEARKLLKWDEKKQKWVAK